MGIGSRKSTKLRSYRRNFQSQNSKLRKDNVNRFASPTQSSLLKQSTQPFASLSTKGASDKNKFGSQSRIKKASQKRSRSQQQAQEEVSINMNVSGQKTKDLLLSLNA